MFHVRESATVLEGRRVWLPAVGQAQYWKTSYKRGSGRCELGDE
jgi:hypothetical protein